MQAQTNLQIRFQRDIDLIAQYFIGEFGLKYEQEAPNLTEPLLRWLDFAFRYIPPVPRTIIYSRKFLKVLHELDAHAQSAFIKLLELMKTGGDINPYQSKGLILYNDTSGRSKQHRTDRLWADWGIHHLHLTDAPLASGSYFSYRGLDSPWLLFCVVGNDFIGLIDVKRHKEKGLFSDAELIRTLAESWPGIIEPYRIKGIQSSSNFHTPNEIDVLRKSGVSLLVTIGSHVYMGPGVGLTTASTSTRVSLAVQKARRYVQELAKIVFDPDGQFHKQALRSGVANPEFNLSITERGLSVYENSQRWAFLLPREGSANSPNFLSELHDLVAPIWAINFISVSK